MDKELQTIKALKDEIDSISDYDLKKDKEKELILLLTQHYPFLLPRNVWTGKLDENYNYSYCRFMNEIPPGWWNTFGLLYLEDLKEILDKYNYIKDFMFSDVKEKHGHLVASSFGAPEEWFSHEYAWEYISKHTCVKCGKFPVKMRDDGWESPWCDGCFKENHDNLNEEDFAKYSEKWTIDKDDRLQEYLVISHFSKDGNYQEWIDMKPYYKLIDWNFTKDDLISLEELQELRKKKKEEEIII